MTFWQPNRVHESVRLSQALGDWRTLCLQRYTGRFTTDWAQYYEMLARHAALVLEVRRGA